MSPHILVPRIRSFALQDPICQSDDEDCNQEFFDARSVAPSDSSFYTARFAASSQADPSGCLSAVSDPSLDDPDMFQNASPIEADSEDLPLGGGLDLVSRMNRLFDECPPVIVPRVYSIPIETEQEQQQPQRTLRVSDDTIADVMGALALPVDTVSSILRAKQDLVKSAADQEDAERGSDLSHDQLPKPAAFKALTNNDAPPEYLLRSDIISYNVVMDVSNSPRLLSPQAGSDSPSAINLLIQDMAQIQHVSRETSGDPRQEEPPSTPAATVSPPEKRAIRTLEGIVKKMSDVTAATAVVAPHDGVATAASCPAMEAAGEDEDDSLSVSESPLIGSALRKRKADAQVFPEDEGHWAPGAPGFRLPDMPNAAASATAPALAPVAMKPGEIAVELVVMSSSTPLKSAVKPTGTFANASMEAHRGSVASRPPSQLSAASAPSGGWLKSLFKGCLCPGSQKWEPIGV